VDDLKVEADTPLVGLPLRPGFPEGSFDELDEDGQPWPLQGVQGIELKEEGDNRFLRLTAQTAGYRVHFDTFYAIPLGTRSIKVRARLRGRDIKPGKELWENARLGFAFADAYGEKVGDWPPTLDVREDTDWAVQEKVVPVPAGAAFLKLTPLLLNTTGVLDIDGLLVEALP
jgi:hypothetical protein